MNIKKPTLNKKAELAVNRYNMLKKDTAVIAAFSGGKDSTALLHWLISIKNEYSISVMAAHVNHNLRGDESDRDEEFVRGFCKNYGIELFVKSVDVDERCKLFGESVELAARSLRYIFFDELTAIYAKNGQNAFIATAHTQSDNAETVLFNLTRGSALSGIAGIPPIRDNIIRPFIYVNNDEILQYCEENYLKYVKDSTNEVNDYTRNFIRNEIIPKLLNINPMAEAAITRLSENVREDDDYLNSEALKYIKENEDISNIDIEYILNVKEFNILSPAVGKRVVFAAYERYLKKTSNNLIKKNKTDEKMLSNIQIEDVFALILSKKTGKSIVISKNDEIFLEYGKAHFKKRNIPEALIKNTIYNENIPVESILKGEFFEKNGVKVIFDDISVKNFKNFEKNYIRNCIDCGKIVDSLFIRTKMDGDAFSPIGRNGNKKLKKLFIDEKIPQKDRKTLPIVCDRDKIVWVAGFGVDEEYKITGETKKALFFEYGKEIASNGK